MPADDWLSAGSDLWTFDEIANRHCLVLLGEPGMGKSETLRAEAAAVAVRNADSGDLVLQIDLGSTRDESVLAREIFESAEFRAWQGSDCELHLFLDSLDEAVLRLGVVADLILRGIRNVDTSRLRLRLACRTADRLPGFEATLRSHWPDDDSGVYELAPLRRADVRLAAADRGLDAVEFIAQIVARNAVPFAIKPVTLRMLLDLVEGENELPESQLDLYDRGLQHLIVEAGERRQHDPQTRGRLSPGQRLALAARVAGATILSGRTGIATLDGSHPTSDVVTFAQLGGGVEVDSLVAVPTPFDVGDAELREVLSTGLFSARGDDLGWAHQTYGEYLAARYLTTTSMSTRQVLSLLVGNEDDGRIVPQLRDVAGWASAMAPWLTDELVARDPLVLLRADVALANDATKRQLVEALLQERVAQELDRWDPRIRRNIKGLQHDGLEAIVRQRLCDPHQPRATRELACEVSAICELVALQAELLHLALDDGEDVRLRADAVNALKTIGDDETLRQLTPLARDALPEDTDDDLKGAVLRAVCPRVIDALETLPLLTPQKQRSFFGAYYRFLAYELPAALTDEELPGALVWIRRFSEDHDPMDAFGSLTEQILLRGAEQADRPDILAALAETVAEYLAHHRELQSFRTRDESAALTADPNRHRLIDALIPAIREGRMDSVSLVASTPRLITSTDLPWLIERLTESVGGDDEATWAELVDWGARFEGSDQDLVMEARMASPCLREQTVARFGPIAIDSELAARMRSRHAEEQEWEEERFRLVGDAPDFDADIDLLLDRFEAGELDAFWRLIVPLWGEEGDLHVSVGSTELTASPGWRRAPASRRARLADAAVVYVREYEPTKTWLDAAHTYFPDSAGYTAIRYLAEHDVDAFRELRESHLCPWVGAILVSLHDDADGDFHSKLLTLLEERCFEQLAEVVERRVIAEAARGEGDLFILYQLQRFLGGRLGDRLLVLWQNETLPVRSQSQLLRALLRAGVNGARQAALSLIDPALIGSDPDRAQGLASALLDSGDSATWSSLRPLVRAHREWGTSLFRAFAHGSDYATDFRSELAEDDLCELFTWLSAAFPAEEDPSRSGAHFVGPREHVGDYRDQILRILVDRGTVAAVQALVSIEGQTGRNLAYARMRAEETWRRNCWVPARPEDVVRLAADAQRRVVLSEADLQRVVIESLERIQNMLRAEGQAHQVWDTAVGRPKRETELAGWIADRMRDDIRGRGIVVNREVEVRVNPRGGVGDRTDIHVDAIAGERVEGANHVTVIVEVKGCWHAELRTAMRTQLADAYLSVSHRHGIYLAVFFGLEAWSDQDDARRRDACGRLDRSELLDDLTEQAQDLRSEGYEIAPVILDASLN